MNTAPSTPTLSSELKMLIQERNVLTTRTKSKVLNALDNQIRLDRENKKQQLKARAIEEIFTSEVSYLRQLEIAMKYFKKPLLESKQHLPDSLISLFENLESVYNVNGELLNQLKLHGEEVAKAFIKVAPFFKLYSVYAYQYRRGLAALQELSKTNSKLDTFIKKQETRPEVGARLGSILIAPIQRIPRYRLLLKELLNYTPKNHPHHSSILGVPEKIFDPALGPNNLNLSCLAVGNLFSFSQYFSQEEIETCRAELNQLNSKKAIKEVEIATEHINDLVSDQENMERTIELQKSFVSGDSILVSPGRKLVKEGPIMKISKKGKKPQQRYLILMSDIIVCCKMTGALFGEANSLRCSCVLPLSKCSLHPVLSDNYFQLICNPVTLSLFSEQRCSTEVWVEVIKQAISKERQNQETLKRKGSQRHLKIKDINMLSTGVTPKKRKQPEENCVTSFCPSPCKKNKLSAESSSTMDTSSENEDNRTTKTGGYFSSVKKLFSNFGQSLNKYWLPVYVQRKSNRDKRLTD